MKKRVVLFLISTTVAAPLFPTSYTWDESAGGVWDVPANWDLDSGFPNATTDSATFPTIDSTSATAVTGINSYTVNALTFSGDTTAYTLSGSGLTIGGTSPVITATGDQAHVISVPLVLDAALAFDIGSGGTVTSSGGISGSFGITTQTGTGTTILSGSNSFTGAISVSAGTLQAGSSNAFPTASTNTVTVSGTLDLYDYNTEVYSLAGSGTVTASDSSGATLTIDHSSTFGGSLTDYLGVTLGSGVTLTLSGSGNDYSGDTSVPSGTVLEAGAADALPSASAITVDGTLALESYSNAIGSLYGSGSITTSTTGVTLQINDGGSYSGTWPSNLTALDLSGGTLQLLSSVDFAYPVTVDGTLDLYDNNTEVYSLAGSGTVTATDSSGATLTIDNSSTFSGSLTDYLGVTLGSDVTLILSGSGNDYSGDTSVPSGTVLEAGATDSLPSSSAITVDGTLALESYSNAIGSLYGSGSITTSTTGVTLQINDGGSYSGTWPSNLTALDLDDGTLQFLSDTSFSYPFTGGSGGIELGAPSPDAVDVTMSFSSAGSSASDTSNTYSGDTTINSGSTLTADAAYTFSYNSAVTVDGVLQLNDYSNSIGGLYGSGAVEVSYTDLETPPTLTVYNGGSFSGTLPVSSGSLLEELDLESGTLQFEGNTQTFSYSFTGGSGGIQLSDDSDMTFEAANSYTGGTTVDVLSTLNVLYSGNFSSSGDFIVNGTFYMNDSATISDDTVITVGPLSGYGTISLGNHALEVAPVEGDGNDNFSGILTGTTLNDYSGRLIVDGDSSGVLILSGSANNYPGSTTVTSGILQAGVNNALPTGTDVLLGSDGTLAVDSYSIEIYSLSGSGTVTTGTETTNLLTIDNGSDPHSGESTFSGSIVDGGSGGVVLAGGTLTLNGSEFSNSYTGATSVNGIAVLQADGANTLPYQSPITLNGAAVLDISTYPSSNQIDQLNGSFDSTVLLGSGAELVITDGGTYLGVISGLGELINETGSLTLEGVNTFSGGTLISSGTLALAGSGGLLSTGAVEVEGTFDISAISSSVTNIGTLTGAGTVNLGNKELRLNPTDSSSTFSGVLEGTEGSFSVVGNGSGSTVILTGTSNTYTGTTLITGSSGALGTLEIGASGALSPQTSIEVQTYGVFQLDSGTTNTALTLTTAGVVNNYSDPSTFTGISMTGGEFNNTGDTTLIFELFLMTGGTLTNGSSSEVDTSSIGSSTTSSDGSFNITDGTIDNYSTFYLTTYTQGSGADLNMYFSLVDPANAAPLISCTGVATLDGTLNVTYNGTTPDSFASYYPLIESSQLVGSFSGTPSISGFSSPEPSLVYTYSDLYLFFASTDAAWGLDGSGSWGVGTSDYVNWTPTGVPGVVDGSTTLVSFNDTPGGSGEITVTLSDETGDAALAVTVFQMNFDSSLHSYTLEEYDSSSSITFATDTDINAQINVDLGTHIIDVPVIIDTGLSGYGLDIKLADGTQLTFESNATITSTSSEVDVDYLEVYQSSSSTLGTGDLINYATLTPNGIYQYGATITNYGTVNLGVYGIYPESEVKAFFNNSGTNAVLESSLTGDDGAMYIGYYGGTTEIVNDGINAVFGPAAADQYMYIGSDGYSGSTTITNSGYNATFGPSGPGGYLLMYGDGTLSVTNTGLGRLMGAFGNGSTVEVSYGTVYNSLGASFYAGSGGTLIISGGSVINDLRSTVGAADQDIQLTSGLLETSGSVLAFNYEQSGSSTLQINLTTLPNVLGQVTVDTTASLGGNLIVNALSGCNFPIDTVVDLIETQMGVSGTFSSVDYAGFPNTINPSITYLLNSVVLDVNATVSSSTSAGSVPEFSFISTNQNNFILGRQVSQLHSRLGHKKSGQEVVARFEEENLEAANEERVMGYISSKETQRQETSVAHNGAMDQEPSRPWNFYIGPIDSLGNINSKGSTQAGVSYNSIGALAGFDYAFTEYGLGFSAAYANTSGRVDHGGHLSLNGVHGSAYGIWAPKNLDQLGVNAIVGYGYEWTSIDRSAGPSSTVTARGTPNGMEVDGLVGVEYVFAHRQFRAFPQNLQLTPLANLQYIYAWLDAYNETGAGQFDLHVKKQTPESLRSLLGARLDYTYVTKDIKFKQEFDIGWQYEYLDNSRQLGFATTNLASTKVVNTQVIGAHGSTLWIGVDFLLTVNEVFEFEASYDLQWNSAYLNNGFYLGLGGNF